MRCDEPVRRVAGRSGVVCGNGQRIATDPAITLTPPIYRRIVGVLLQDDQRGIDGVGVSTLVATLPAQRAGALSSSRAGASAVPHRQPSQPQPARARLIGDVALPCTPSVALRHRAGIHQCAACRPGHMTSALASSDAARTSSAHVCCDSGGVVSSHRNARTPSAWQPVDQRLEVETPALAVCGRARCDRPGARGWFDQADGRR